MEEQRERAKRSAKNVRVEEELADRRRRGRHDRVRRVPDPRVRRPAARADRARRTGAGRDRGRGGPLRPGPDAVLRGVRRSGRRPGPGPGARRDDRRDRRAVRARRHHRAHRRRRVRRDPRGRGGPRRGGRRSAARRPPAPTPRPTSCTGRCATCWAITRGRQARSSRPAACGSTSRTTRRSRTTSSSRPRSWPTAGWPRTARSRSTRRRWTRPRTRARSRCSARSTGTSSASSRWGTTRSSSAGAPTSTTPARSRSCGSCTRRSIGAGMRRVEALVGPDALREINMERDLLYAIAQELGTDPKGALERARQYAERVKQLESELGKQAKQELKDRAEQLAVRGEGRRGRQARHRHGGCGRRRAPRARAGRREPPREPGRRRRRARHRAGRQGAPRGGEHEEPDRPRRDRAGAARTRGEDRRRRCGRQAEPRVLRRPEGRRVPGGPRRGRAPSEGAARSLVGEPGRVLGLDLGDARIGVAISDDARRMAVPLGTVRTGAPADVKAIADLVREHGVTLVVVGHPLLLSGEAGERAHHAERFAAALTASSTSRWSCRTSDCRPSRPNAPSGRPARAAAIAAGRSTARPRP